MAKVIVKAAAGKKRAAFAIEEAIADTRSRIAASAGADLRQKAQAALSSTQPETHGALIERITKELKADARRSMIDASEGHAERYAKRDSAAAAFLRGIEVKDYSWGAIFEGTKAALVRAGLVDAKAKQTRGTDKKYCLPRNWKDGYDAACFGPTYGAIPKRWEATCYRVEEVGRTPKGNPLLCVRVEFNTDDFEVRERMLRALEELERPDMNAGLLRMLILQIPPVPLSIRIPEAIKAAKKYPTEKQRLKARK